jgi:hypothetical protein
LLLGFGSKDAGHCGPLVSLWGTIPFVWRSSTLSTPQFGAKVMI